MDPTQAYQKAKRNLLLFSGLLFLAIFVGFESSYSASSITVFPFTLSRAELIPTILFFVVLFNLFQFSLCWAAQRVEIQRNLFHRVDFFSATSIGALSVVSYLGSLAWPYLNLLVGKLPSIIGQWDAKFLSSLLAAALIFASLQIAAIVAKLAGRVSVWLRARAKSYDAGLEEILLSQNWLLIFNPAANKSKEIEFKSGGEIGLGRNNNEHTWRIRSELLELLNNEGKIHSRFSYDDIAGVFSHTNEVDTLSYRSQKLVPLDWEQT